MELKDFIERDGKIAVVIDFDEWFDFLGMILEYNDAATELCGAIAMELGEEIIERRTHEVQKLRLYLDKYISNVREDVEMAKLMEAMIDAYEHDQEKRRKSNGILLLHTQ